MAPKKSLDVPKFCQEQTRNFGERKITAELVGTYSAFKIWWSSDILTAVKKQTSTGLDWLYERMDRLQFETLEDVAKACDLNRGNLYRYFTFETRPSIDVIPKLCEGLNASPLEILQALGIQNTSN